MTISNHTARQYAGQTVYRQRAERILREIGATKAARRAVERTAGEMLAVESYFVTAKGSRRNNTSGVASPDRHIDALRLPFRDRRLLGCAAVDLAAALRGHHGAQRMERVG